MRTVPVHALHFLTAVTAFINIKIVFYHLYILRRRNVELVLFSVLKGVQVNACIQGISPLSHG